VPARTVKIALIRILTATLAGALLPTSCALAQPASTDLQEKVFRGNWIATVGPKEVFRGRWSGEALPNTPNAAQGSWTLLSDTNRILLEGTWSARKSAWGWHGTWSARTAHGQSFSGTWEAGLAGFSGKTLEEMLIRTAEKQISGLWRSGRLSGNWWLSGSP
jgi:hypothetical protein